MKDVSVVLAHGAWADGSSWARVITALKLYVTALAPDEGEKVAEMFYRLEPHPQAPKLVPDANGFIWLRAFATALRTQRYTAERMKANVTAHAVDHTPSVTAPAAVVDVIAMQCGQAAGLVRVARWTRVASR